ncbi:MAG: hypothetical protein ACYSWP_00330 [Planctomycetota bacterium]|jgi:hypothetical protein
MRIKDTVLLFAVLNAVIAQAGIPEPDMTVFGEVSVGAQTQGAHDNVSIVARVSGEPNSFVGAYQMGDNPSAGDHYVLKIHLESLADGSSQSANAALIGQTVDIFVRPTAYSEVLATSVTVGGRGQVQYFDLYVDAPEYSAMDLNTDGIVNFKDFADVANNWDRKDCGTVNNWCNGCDVNQSTGVDYFDLNDLAGAWLATASP